MKYLVYFPLLCFISVLKPSICLVEKLRESVSSSMGVGELEITPVSAAIARYLGIDLSSEGKAARNRRGLAVIVNGAPMSGILKVKLHPFKAGTST